MLHPGASYTPPTTTPRMLASPMMSFASSSRLGYTTDLAVDESITCSVGSPTRKHFIGRSLKTRHTSDWSSLTPVGSCTLVTAMSITSTSSASPMRCGEWKLSGCPAAGRSGRPLSVASSFTVWKCRGCRTVDEAPTGYSCLAGMAVANCGHT